MNKLVAVVVMAVCAAAASAQPGMGMGPGPNASLPAGNRHEAMMAKLNLTDDQQAQMEKLRIDMQKKQTALRAKIQIARLDMQELFNATAPDRNAIEKKMKEIGDLRLQQELNQLDHQFAVRGILNPEQQKIWKHEMMFGGPQGRMGGRMRGWNMEDEMRPGVERRIERRIEKNIENE
jgi:nickel and cobalt resistance protein CnrR